MTTHTSVYTGPFPDDEGYATSDINWGYKTLEFKYFCNFKGAIFNIIIPCHYPFGNLTDYELFFNGVSQGNASGFGSNNWFPEWDDGTSIYPNSHQYDVVGFSVDIPVDHEEILLEVYCATAWGNQILLEGIPGTRAANGLEILGSTSNTMDGVFNGETILNYNGYPIFPLFLMWVIVPGQVNIHVYYSDGITPAPGIKTGVGCNWWEHYSSNQCDWGDDIMLYYTGVDGQVKVTQGKNSPLLVSDSPFTVSLPDYPDIPSQKVTLTKETPLADIYFILPAPPPPPPPQICDCWWLLLIIAAEIGIYAYKKRKKK